VGIVAHSEREYAMAGLSLKVLDQKLTELQQQINGLSMTVDSHWATVQADVLTLKQEVGVYFNTTPTPAPRHEASPVKAPVETRAEPWRLTLEEFINFKSDCHINWDDNGNAKVAQRLARSLRRSSGHAEGQLYINWAKQNGRASVKAFWISRGFSEIPEGL
jgi:hypothetical protein